MSDIEVEVQIGNAVFVLPVAPGERIEVALCQRTWMGTRKTYLVRSTVSVPQGQAVIR